MVGGEPLWWTQWEAEQFQCHHVSYLLNRPQNLSPVLFETNQSQKNSM